MQLTRINKYRPDPIFFLVVAEENRDHEAVYALIAKDTGATADSVGRALAKQITANSRPGVWVQDEAGAWKKK